MGQQQDAVDVLRTMLADDDCEVRAACVSGPLMTAVAALSGRIPRSPSAEEACMGRDGGLVVIAESGGEDSLRLVRVATQAGQHVLVLPPDDVTPAWGFELQLIQDESSTAVMPFCGAFLLPDDDRLTSALRARPLPRQVRVELEVQPHASESLPERQREALSVALATGYQYTSVIAVDQMAPDGELLQRTITLGASRESQGVVPATTIVLESRPGRDPDQFVVVGSDGDELCVPLSSNPDWLPRCRQLMVSRKEAQQWMADFTAMLELDHAADRSLRRRRAIDVQFDSGSERSVFKSQMTAIGCLVLLLMMGGLIGYLILAQLFELPERVMRIVRAIWIAPAVLYLLAQLLLPVARDRSRRP